MRNQTKPKVEIKKSAKTAVKPSSSLFSDISSVSSVYQEGQLDVSELGFFSGLLFLELMSFQVPVSFDGDKENCLLATPDRVSTPDCLSAKPSSSQNSFGSSPRRSTVPLDLSMLSAARTCYELETERTFPES